MNNNTIADNWWKSIEKDDQIFMMMELGFEAPFDPGRVSAEEIQKIFLLKHPVTEKIDGFTNDGPWIRIDNHPVFEDSTIIAVKDEVNSNNFRDLHKMICEISDVRGDSFTRLSAEEREANINLIAGAQLLYIKNKQLQEIAAVRQQEILDGKHAWTVPPLYVVYEQTITCCDRKSEMRMSTTLFNESADIEVRFMKECGQEAYELWNHEMFKEADFDEEISVPDPENEGEFIEYTPVVRVGFHDRFVTCCFTRQAAEEFIEREKHNLSNPRIWVHGIERRNIQMVELGQLLGDK